MKKLEIKDHYIYDGQVIIRNTIIVIPPTDGDRTDIIGESNKYYYGINKKEFKKLYPNDTISITIEIKKGIVELK